jgi:hypothetical protein
VIDFRYHIVSIVAVFLALALGLFLGSTTLQSTVTRNLHHQADTVTGRNKALRAQNNQLSSALGHEQQFTASTEPYMLANRLTGASVALVSAPGVDGKTRKDVSAALQEAGATVSADVSLQSAYVDPTQEAELGQLANELAPRRRLSGSGSSRVSSELASALVVRPGHNALSRGRVQTDLTALADGKFISLNSPPPAHQASLAVMLLAPAGNTTPTVQQAQDAILLKLASDLRASTSGTVLAGPDPVPGGSGGTLTAAQSDGNLSKTTSIVTLEPDSGGNDPAAGRIAIVLALANAPAGVTGVYGLGQNPPLPSPSPTP